MAEWVISAKISNGGFMVEWTKYPYTAEWAFVKSPCNYYLHAPPAWTVLWQSEEENLQITLVKDASVLRGFTSHQEVPWKPEWMGRVEDSVWGRIIESPSILQSDLPREVVSTIEWTACPNYTEWVFVRTCPSYWINNPPNFNVLFEDDTCQIALIREGNWFLRNTPPTVTKVPWSPPWMGLCPANRWVDIASHSPNNLTVEADPVPPKSPIVVIPYVGMGLFQRLSGLSEEKIKLVLKCR